MKNQIISFLFVLLLSLCSSRVKAQSQPSKVLRHIVLITFKEGALANEIKAVDDSFRHLATTLTMVKGYETGTTIPEGQTKTTTHIYSFTFASEQDLASYGASAEHQQHIKIGKSIIERGQAVDYWVEK